jgi:HEAT repeat protein
MPRPHAASSRAPKITIDDALDLLLNEDRSLTQRYLELFSDLSSKDIAKVKMVWPQIEAKRRQGLLKDLIEFADIEPMMFYDELAEALLDDKDPSIRASALELLWQTEEPHLIDRFMTLLLADPVDTVRANAATGLAKFVYLGELEDITEKDYKRVVEALAQTFIGDEPDTVKRRALEALSFSGDARADDFIKSSYNRKEQEWVVSALFSMGRSANEAWNDTVLSRINDQNPEIAAEAITAAGELGIKAAREPILEMIDQGIDDEDVRFAVIEAIAKIGGESVRSALEMMHETARSTDEEEFIEGALEELEFTDLVNLGSMLEIEGEDGMGAMFEDDLSDEGENDSPKKKQPKKRK